MIIMKFFEQDERVKLGVKKVKRTINWDGGSK